MKSPVTFAVLCAWLLLFAVQSAPTAVGAGDEHVAMALNLARADGPAFTADEFAAVDATRERFGRPL